MRSQLTLFVPAPSSATVEALRLVLDPVQASLIAAHVTLCREDEIAGIPTESLLDRARAWPFGAVTLTFGAPRRFMGHGVLLPCEAGDDRFQQLRRWLLRDDGARVHAAHLTMAHPRNPPAPGNRDEMLASLAGGRSFEFDAVALIRQEASTPWVQVGEASIARR